MCTFFKTQKIISLSAFLTGEGIYICKRYITQWLNSAFTLYFKISPFPYHWPQFYSFILLSKTNKCMFDFNHVLCWRRTDPYLMVEADLCRGFCDTPALVKLASLTLQTFAELGICSVTAWESLCIWGVKLFSLIENGSWDVALCPFGSQALPGSYCVSFLCILSRSSSFPSAKLQVHEPLGVVTSLDFAALPKC